MTNNEIISKWLDESRVMNYNTLHEAWVKFRDLDLDGVDFMDHRDYCVIIAVSITHGTITEDFDDLVKGIEWYNSIK